MEGRPSRIFFCGLEEERFYAHAARGDDGLLALPYVEGCAGGEGDTVGLIECFQVHLPHPDAKLDGHKGAEQLAALARMERGRRQAVVHRLESFQIRVRQSEADFVSILSSRVCASFIYIVFSVLIM